MHLNRFARALILVLLLAPALFAATAEDLSGKWSGSFMVSVNGNPPSDEGVYMVAKHTGAVIAGTVGPTVDKQFTMVKGKVETIKEAGKDVTKVSFDASEAEGAPPIHFALTLVGGHLKGKAEAEMNGMKLSATLDLARIK